MGATFCSEQGRFDQCVPDRCCGKSGRQSEDVPVEYRAAAKLAGLLESVELGLPAVVLGRDDGVEEDGATRRELGLSPVREEGYGSLDAESAANTAREVAQEGVQAAEKGMHFVQEAAANPIMAAAALGTVERAVGHGVHDVEAAVLEVRSWIQGSHCTVNVFCFLVALALLGSSVICAMGVLGSFEPFQFCVAFYNALFAIVIMSMDGPPAWNKRGCGTFQKRLFHAVPAFLSQRGRALFYLYVGSVNLAMVPDDFFWRLIYLGVGGSLVCVAGMMFAHTCCRRRHMLHTPHQATDAANVLHEVAALAQGDLFHVKSYIQGSHCSMRTFTACIALALLASSLLGVLNFFEAIFKPFQYMVAFYNAVFAFVILIVDGMPHTVASCLFWNMKRRLLHNAHFLATCRGRAFFYFYVGSINLAVLPSSEMWKYIYMGIGGSLCLVSVISLAQHFIRHRRRK